MNGDGRTPSRTSNPFGSDGGKTPAWNPSSHTPNPHQDGGKTPAWNASSRTPNPYQDGNKTPAWNASSRTPNPYINNDSPAWGNDGGRTPRPGWGGGWGSGSDNNNAWGNGNASPARPADASYSSYSTWVSTTESAVSTTADSFNRVHRHQQLLQHRLLLRLQPHRIQVRQRLVPWDREVLCTRPRHQGSWLQTRMIRVSNRLC